MFIRTFIMFACACGLAAEVTSDSVTMIAVIGAGGQEEYQKEFEQSAAQWEMAAQQAEARFVAVGREKDGTNDLKILEKSLAAIPKESAEPLPERATVGLQMSDANTAVLTFTPASGMTLQGTQQLARLNFTAVPAQNSAFVPLQFSSVEPTLSVEDIDPTVLVNDGRLVVLGTRALLEARRTAGNRELVLYGRPGNLVTIQSRLSMTTGAWANRTSYSMTNFSQVVPAPSPTVPIIYYRLRQ